VLKEQKIHKGIDVKNMNCSRCSKDAKDSKETKVKKIYYFSFEPYTSFFTLKLPFSSLLTIACITRGNKRWQKAEKDQKVN